MFNEKERLELFTQSYDAHELSPILDEELNTSNDMEYTKTYTDIRKKMLKKRELAMKDLDLSLNVVLDGNLYSLDGYSENEDIERVQKVAFRIMQHLQETEKICELDVTSLNSALSAALSVSSEDSVYYQTLYENKENDFISCKVSNIPNGLFLHPNKIFTLLKNIYFMGARAASLELISFTWIFLETSLLFLSASKSSVSIEQVLVVLYIQRFACPNILEDDLVRHIREKELKFDDNRFNSLELSRDKIYSNVTSLSDVGIINIDSGMISLAERVALPIRIQEEAEL